MAAVEQGVVSTIGKYFTVMASNNYISRHEVCKLDPPMFIADTQQCGRLYLQQV